MKLRDILILDLLLRLVQVLLVFSQMPTEISGKTGVSVTAGKNTLQHNFGGEYSMAPQTVQMENKCLKDRIYM